MLHSAEEGGGLGNDSHPCSLCISGSHGCSDNQAAIQEAEWTVANPFPFL